MASHIINSDQLEENLGDADWALVDARFYLPEPDRAEHEYLEAHIPGAVYAHLDKDLSAPASGTNGRHPMPSDDVMVDRFSSWGIDDDVQVVVYDTAGGTIAARLWWMLRYMGHERAAVLDGGLPLWKRLGLPLAEGREARERRTFIGQPSPFMRIDVDALADARKDLLLIDARAEERFRGEVEPLDPVAGHIPGAKNHACSTNLGTNGRFLPADTLRERLTSVLGDTPPESVVSYCGSGVTACHNLLAMERAGLRGARLYPGSWSEWCADPNRPVETD